MGAVAGMIWNALHLPAVISETATVPVEPARRAAKESLMTLFLHAVAAWEQIIVLLLC